MDIRKYLAKSSSKKNQRSSGTSALPPSSSQSTSRVPTRSSRTRSGKAQDVAMTDPDPHGDDDEDFIQVKRKRSTVKRKAEYNESPTPKKRRASTEASAANKAVGFGGTDIADGVEDQQKTPKKKWVPRTDAPPNRGNKELPVGKPDCLKGKVFVITGVLDSLLREECSDLVKEYGGRVVGGVSGKVTHGIVGTEPGDSKMKKLKEKRCAIVDEDGLFEMIRASLPKGHKESNQNMEEEVEEVEEVVAIQRAPISTPHVKKKTSSPPAVVGKLIVDLWVDKYKPETSSDLVANKKIINDLKDWLSAWKSKFLYGDGHHRKLKGRGDKDFAAALLVGPPGIGKTTAAHIVCKELGFEPHEFNASDVRNKGGVQMLAETVMVANTISKYLNVSGKHQTGRKKIASFPEGQVLIMDEVDGMSGGDRGGSQELIKMIKTSKVPVICIANDETSSNMRSLGNNCFRLRFRRPMASQVTKRLLDIAKREGFRQIQDQTITKLAEGCNGDIRQMINMLQAWRSSSPSLTFGQVKKRLQLEGKTVMQKSIFELARGFFTPGPVGSTNSLMARTDNFFADSDLMPLFIHENYIKTVAAKQSLESLADAAESIADGDLCNRLVRMEQRWELMPAMAVMSSIRPGTICAGGLNAQPMFPSYLGNLSKGNKWKRIVQGLEMKTKAVQTTTGSVRAFRLDYIPAMTTCLATPLIRDGSEGALEVVDRLDAYYLERDPDWTEILEAGVYGKGRSPLENIKGPVKTALTREYNSRAHKRSTVTGMRVGNKKGVAADFEKAKGKGYQGADVAVVDDDPLDIDEEEEEEEGVEGVVAEFGVKAKKGRRKTPTKGAKKNRVSSSRRNSRKRK